MILINPLENVHNINIKPNTPLLPITPSHPHTSTYVPYITQRLPQPNRLYAPSLFFFSLLLLALLIREDVSEWMSVGSNVYFKDVCHYAFATTQVVYKDELVLVLSRV